MKFLIFKRNDEEVAEQLGSYESDFKDDTSANRSHEMAEPKAIHIQLPEGLDADCVKPEFGEIEAEHTVTLREAVEAQPEKWVRGEEEVFTQPHTLDEFGEPLHSDGDWTYVPAVEAQPALEVVVPAVLGWKLVADEVKVAAKQAYEAEATKRYVKSVIEAAKAFGNDLMNDFATENVMMGITQEGKTSQVRKAMAEVIMAITTGSLKDAIVEAKLIPEIQKDPKYITDARLLSFINKIETYLEVPLSTDLE